MRTTEALVHIQAWIKSELHYKLQQLAQRRSTTDKQVTMAELVREALRNLVEKKGSK